MAFDEECEVAPGVVAKLTGGHTPGHCVVHVASGGERLTFAGDALFPVGFDHPDWHNGFEHDPEESVRVRVRLLQQAAARSEEHTSELQSLMRISYAVFCLTKKKNKKQNDNISQ